MSLLRLQLTRAALAPPRLLLRRSFLATCPLSSDSQPPASTTLRSLQTELKNAMRAKDKPRLTAIRAVLAEITNASKTAKPVDSDAHLYTLLLKQIKASNAAIDEFDKAEREDLVSKEKAQLSVLEELKGRITVVGEADVESAVRAAVEALRSKGNGTVNPGAVVGVAMGKLSSAGPVDVQMVKAKADELAGAET